jgi:hypothetical protein
MLCRPRNRKNGPNVPAWWHSNGDVMLARAKPRRFLSYRVRLRCRTYNQPCAMPSVANSLLVCHGIFQQFGKQSRCFRTEVGFTPARKL